MYKIAKSLAITVISSLLLSMIGCVQVVKNTPESMVPVPIQEPALSPASNITYVHSLRSRLDISLCLLRGLGVRGT
jgi:hypothetical protein